MLCLKAAGADQPKPKGPVCSATPNKNECGTGKDCEGKASALHGMFCWVFHGLSAAFWALQGSQKKRRKAKTTGQAKGKAVKVEHTSLQRAPLSSCKSQKKVWEELRLAFAGSSGWGHKGVQEGMEAQPWLRANPDNQGDPRKETAKLCSKHRN